MSPPRKLAFIGEPGSGKSTCVAALSDIAAIDTEVACSDASDTGKATTTAALDYGLTDLAGQGRLMLYGLPGQPRFGFMFALVRPGLAGVVIVVDAASARGLDGFSRTLEAHVDSLRDLPCVVALNKSATMNPVFPAACRQRLRKHGLLFPLLRMDARRREDGILLVERLLDLPDRALLTTAATQEPALVPA